MVWWNVVCGHLNMAQLTQIIVLLNLAESGTKSRLLCGFMWAVKCYSWGLQSRNKSPGILKALRACCPKEEPWSQIFYSQKLLWLKKSFGKGCASWPVGTKWWQEIRYFGITASALEVWEEALGLPDLVLKHKTRCLLFNCVSVQYIFHCVIRFASCL